MGAGEEGEVPEEGRSPHILDVGREGGSKKTPGITWPALEE